MYKTFNPYYNPKKRPLPLKIVFNTDTVSELEQLQTNVKNELNKMSEFTVHELYSNVTTYNSIKFEKKHIEGIEGREVVVVTELDNTPIEPVMFYKSTGKSRGTGLENLWLLYGRIDDSGTYDMIIKPENELYKRIMNDKDKLLELKKWKRFINEQNVRISKKLFEMSV